MGRFLAIDYGIKRCGIAVSDPLKIIATGLETVPTKNLFEFLKSYLKREPVERFVVGDPKNMNNTDSEMTAVVNAFCEQLKKDFPLIPVHRVDERLTSRMALRSLAESGHSKNARKNKGLVDEVSAVLILQTFMELFPA